MRNTHAGYRPFLTTKLGVIHGKVGTFLSEHLEQTGSLKAYLGIPYAKPPIGDRRFRHAEPVEPWTEEINVTETPPSCPQIVPAYYEELINSFRISEDCLYLNVFVPRTVVSTQVIKCHL